MIPHKTRLRSAAIALVALPGAVTPLASQVSARTIAASAQPAVVLITSLDTSGAARGRGSGFFVSSDGLFITNYHVIEEASSLEVTLATGEVFDNVYLVTTDPRRDLAILKIPIEGQRHLKLGSDSQAAVGDPVYAVGNPLGLEGTFSNGIISSIRTDGGVRLLQITAPISPGSSGGPLLNSVGEVIGVTTAFMREGQNVNWAVPVRYVRPLLATGETPRRFSSVSAPSISSPSARPNSGRSPAAWVAVEQPAGTYGILSAVEPSSRRMLLGHAVIVPDIHLMPQGYKLVGWWAAVDIDSDEYVTDPRLLNEPVTITPSGRVALELARPLEGGFVAPDKIILRDPQASPQRPSAMDSVVLWRSEAHTALSSREGIYRLNGQSTYQTSGRASDLEGILGVTGSPIPGKEHLFVTIQLLNSRGGSVTFAATGAYDQAGRVVLNSVTLNDNSVIRGSVEFSAGRVQVELTETQASRANSHLNKRYQLRGTKIGP